MYRAMSRRLAGEEGVALITAVMISAIVMVLGATAVSVAIHNSEASSRDRRRVQSIGSAEAGLDYYFSHLQDVSPGEIQCAITQELTGSPTAAFVVEAEYFDEAGDLIPCETLSDDILPDSALITSEGTTSGVNPTRTMQSFIYLIPKPPKAFGDSAIFSDGDPTFSSNVQVISGAAINADIYTNGNIRFESNSIVNGSVYAQGSIEMASNSEVKRNLWAGTTINLSGNSIVRGDVTASSSSVTMTNQAHVYGDAQAATTITTSGTSVIDGLRIQNTPYDPPPQRPFPEYTYDPQDWIDAGHSVSSFSDCNAAREYITGISGGDHTVRITSSCLLEMPSNSTTTVRGNLAIISEGGLRMRSNSSFVSDGNEHNLFLIFGLGKVSPCDIDFESNTDVGDDLTTLFYTPCTINMNSNSFAAKGQMFGGKVNFSSNSNLTFELIPVPGLAPAGFDEDITYIREVITEADPI